MAIEKVRAYFAQFGIADRVQEFDVSSWGIGEVFWLYGLD